MCRVSGYGQAGVAVMHADALVCFSVLLPPHLHGVSGRFLVEKRKTGLISFACLCAGAIEGFCPTVATTGTCLI